MLPTREQQLQVSTFSSTHVWKTDPDPDTSLAKGPTTNRNALCSPPAWLQQGVNAFEGFLCVVAVTGWGGQIKSHNPLPTPRGTREPWEQVQDQIGNWMFCRKE